MVGIPTIWASFDKFMVNSFGAPVNSGIIPTVAILGAIFYFAYNYAVKKNSSLILNLVIVGFLSVVSFSTFGVVITRANASPPINMNVPDNPHTLLPYLNREQYGERPLLKGPHFEAKPIKYDKEKRWGVVEKTNSKGEKTTKTDVAV